LSLPTNDDLRFFTPLYTVAEAGRALDVSPSTFATWAKGYTRPPSGKPAVTASPVVTAIKPLRPGMPTIPFVGLAEGMVLAAVRRAGVSLQRIRPALVVLASNLGVEHALASRRLFTDGAELLFDYAEQSADPDAQLARQLVVIRSGQHVFADIVQDYLKRIDYAPDGYARLLMLPAYQRAEVVVDPSRSFGQPIFSRSGARVSDVPGRFWAGDDLDTLTDEFGVPRAELEDVLRVSHPVGLPDLFVDRSLGRLKVPTLLRAAGLRLVTLAERYGIPNDETIDDTVWLADAGRRSEAVFMKDDRIRYNEAEKQAVVDQKVLLLPRPPRLIRSDDGPDLPRQPPRDYRRMRH
jgi:uncharacterized protein (DUF433 family)